MYGIYDNSNVIAQFAAPISVRSNVPVFAVDALSLKRTVARRPAQRWEIESALEPLSFGANRLFSYIVSKGDFSVVTILMPQNYGAKKALTSNSTPTATGTADSSSIAIAGNTGLIPMGTFVRFSNHSKIYMTTSDIVGNGSVGIFPALRVSITALQFNFKDDVIMNAFIDTDSVKGMSYTDGILMDLGAMKFVESL